MKSRKKLVDIAKKQKILFRKCQHKHRKLGPLKEMNIKNDNK